MEVSLNCCSQNGGNLYRAPYYNRNLNIGPRIDSNLGQSPNIPLVQNGTILGVFIIQWVGVFILGERILATEPHGPGIKAGIRA